VLELVWSLDRTCGRVSKGGYIMKYYSETLKKAFDTEKECLAAEKAYEDEQSKAKALAEKKNADRKAAAEKVEQARIAAVNANKAYKEALADFCEKHGTFHASYSGQDINDLFDWFFKF